MNINTVSTPNTRLHPSAKARLSSQLLNRFLDRLDEDEIENLNEKARILEDKKRDTLAAEDDLTGAILEAMKG